MQLVLRLLVLKRIYHRALLYAYKMRNPEYNETWYNWDQLPTRRWRYDFADLVFAAPTSSGCNILFEALAPIMISDRVYVCTWAKLYLRSNFDHGEGYQLISQSVWEGFAEDIIQSARLAGASGTVIQALFTMGASGQLNDHARLEYLDEYGHPKV